MKTKTKLTLASTGFAIALMLISPIELSAQKNKTKKDDGKVHLKIVENVNGVETVIDTTFDKKDKEGIEKFMQEHNPGESTNLDLDNGNVYMYKFNDDEKEMSDEAQQKIKEEMDEFKNSNDYDSEKLKSDMDKWKEELNKMKELKFKFDTMPDGSFNFQMNIPDKMEMDELGKRMNELKIEIPDMPDMRAMPPMLNFDFNTDGMSEQDKKQFDEHMKKAKEEMQKAFELMKDSTGKMKLQFNFDSDSKDGGYNTPDSHGDFLFDFPPMISTTCIAGANGNGKRCCIKIAGTDSMHTNCTAGVSIIGDKNNDGRKVIIITKHESSADSKTSGQKPQDKKSLKAPKATAPETTEAFADLTCFPNPNSGTFDVKFTLPTKGNLEVKIVDASGKEIVSETFEEFMGTFNKQYDLSKQGKGVYMLMIKQGDKWNHKKIVVK